MHTSRVTKFKTGIQITGPGIIEKTYNHYPKGPGMSSQYVTMPKNAEEFQYLGDLYEENMLKQKEKISRLKAKVEHFKVKSEKWERKYKELRSKEMVSKEEKLWRHKQEYDNLALKDEPTMGEFNRMLDLEDRIWELEEDARTHV